MTEVVGLNSIEAYLKREHEHMKFEQNRLDSFDSRWFDVYQEANVPGRLARAGFYRTHGDYTECFSCGLSKHLSFWWMAHDPEKIHREERPNCKFITGQSDNVPMGLSVVRRFQIFINNIFNQNEEIEQPDNNQTKLRSENQQLEVDTGTKAEQITENENSDEKQWDYIKPISQPSLPGVLKPDKPQEKKVNIIKRLKEKFQTQIKKGTTLNKEQIQPESHINDKYAKTNQNRETEPGMGSWREAEEISGTKRPASERPEVIPSNSSPSDVPFSSNENHDGQNIDQRSAAAARSSSSDVRVDKLTSRKVPTSKTHQELEKKNASESIKEKTESVTTSQSRDVNREKSVNNSRNHQEHLTSSSSRNSSHTDSPKNAVLDYSDVREVKPDTTCQECFTSEILCSTVGSVHSLFHIAVSSLKDLFLSC